MRINGRPSGFMPFKFDMEKGLYESSRRGRMPDRERISREYFSNSTWHFLSQGYWNTTIWPRINCRGNE